MTRNPPQNVIVHNDREDDQEEHQADLYKALLEAQAQIAPHDSLNRKKQNIPTVQDGNRQEIQNAQVNADKNHKENYVHRPSAHGLARHVRNSHRSVELIERDAPAESFPDHVRRSPDGVDGPGAGEPQALAERYVLVGAFVPRKNPDLVSILSGLRRILLRCYGQMRGLSLAGYIQRHGLAIRGLGSLPELFPELNFLSVHSGYLIALPESGVLCRRAWSDLIDDRANGRISQDSVRVDLILYRDLDRFAGSRIVHFHLDGRAWRGLLECEERFLPTRSGNSINRENDIASF